MDASRAPSNELRLDISEIATISIAEITILTM
jgi:hypothetical protein